MKNDLKISYPLFANPSIVEGIGRILDLGATLQQYNYSTSEREADNLEIYNDWMVIGNDIRSSIMEYEKTTTK